MSYAQVLNDVYREQTMVNYVSGHDRRPLVPQLTDIPVIIQQHKQESGPINQKQEEIYIEPKQKDVEVQTMYRESEAQTDPYSPKYIKNEGEQPEVLLLEHLKWNKGLPAGIDELDSIEQKREKMWFENSLPPISDEASFHLRRKLMEEQELREWSKKEQEIKKLQNERLYLLQSALIEREKEVEDRNAQRIEEIRHKKNELKNRLVAKIQRRKIKVLRKMLKSRKVIDQDTRKRDIIEDYANFASRVYAGISREGLSLDKIANKYEVQPVALTSYQGMEELQKGIKPSETHTMVNVKKYIKEIQKSYTRLEIQHKQSLQKATDEIAVKQTKKDLQEEMKDETSYSLTNAKNKIRPNTPTWSYNTEFALTQYPQNTMLIEEYKQHCKELQQKDKRNAAVLMLQRLIRGRCIQNIMYEGKEKRMALINELLQVAQIENKPEEVAEEILLHDHEERVKNAVLESIQGEVISDTLDMLSKELLKIKQERKIAEMVKIAENDRRIREIEEGGKRQAEEILRAREDVLYNELMRVRQGTVDTYLDWIINNTVEKASTRQATIMANLRREQMNKPLEQFERRFNNQETIIKDLVHAFLIPNVQRSKIQRQIEIVEKRFNEAAKKSLQNTLIKASNVLKEDEKSKDKQ